MKDTDNCYNKEETISHVPDDGLEEIEIEPIDISDM